MKKIHILNFIFINQYVYQLQTRLYKFEKKNQYKMTEKIEGILSESWSLTKSYLFIKKKIKKNNINFKYLKLLKHTKVHKTQIHNNFMYIKFIQYLLLKQLCLQIKFKPYNNYNKVSVNKFLYIFYKSNFFLIKFGLIKSLLIYLTIYQTKQTLYCSIIKNYYRIIYLNFLGLHKKINNKLRFSGLNKMHNSVIVATVKKNHKFLSQSLFFVDNTKKLLFLNNIDKTFNLSKAYLLSLNEISCSIQNAGYLEQHFKIKSRRGLVHRTMSGYLPKKRVTPKYFFLKTLVSTSFPNRLIKLKLHYLKNFDKFNYFFLKSGITSKADYSTLFKINLKKKNILFSLDKQVAILKLQNFLIYLLLLRPKYAHNLSEECYFNGTNYSKNDAIKFLIKNLKVQSQYFLHFIIRDSYNYLPSTIQINKKFFYLNFNSLQLKTLLKKIMLNSSLFEYLLKNLKTVNSNFEIQCCEQINTSTLLSSYCQTRLASSYDHNKFNISKNFNVSTYCLKKERSIIRIAMRRKNINFLFFNILFNGVGLKIKHYILIKNAKIIFLSLKSTYITNTISSLFKTNFIFLNPANFHLNSLPNFIGYQNQILILKKDSNMIYECLTVLKKMLYLQGFVLEFSQIKIGHTLFSYNKNSPGLDFLGFFICQYDDKTNRKLKLNSTSFFSSNQKAPTLPYLGKTRLGQSLVTENQQTFVLNLTESNNKKSIFISPQIPTFTTLNTETQHISNVIQLSKKVIITTLHPSKKEIKIYFDKLKKIIKNSNAISQESLIFKLSNNIRIWAYYYNIISNKKILQYCDYLLFKMLWRWCCRRHPSKNKKWIKYKYFHKINGITWVFGVYKPTTSYLICLPNHSDIKLLKYN